MSVELDESIQQKISQWFEAEQMRSTWVAKEAALRRELAAHFFPNADSGTHKVRIDHGMALVGTFRVNYTVNAEALEQYRQDGVVAPILKKVITYKPDLITKEWNSLTTEDQAKVCDLVTEKPGLPKLEIKPQSKVRW